MGLKCLGMVLVMAGSIGAGVWYRLRYLERFFNLRECQRALSLLKGEIQYGRVPLPEACHEVGKRIRGTGCHFFQQVAQRLEEGDGSVEQIWREVTEAVFISSRMGEKDQEEWKELGATLGYLDVELQVRTLDRYLHWLQQTIDRTEAEKGNSTRIYPLLAAFGGAMLCLVLIS